MSVYIQIIDGVVVTVFPSEQDLEFWPGTIEVEEDDLRYLKFIEYGKKAPTERAWRNQELIRADYELNKVQDADLKAVGTVGAWREYRKALRQYPQHKDFPSPDSRPKSPESI